MSYHATENSCREDPTRLWSMSIQRLSAHRTPETKHQKPHTRKRAPETAHKRPSTRGRTPETAHQRPETAHKRPSTKDQRPHTRDPPLPNGKSRRVQPAHHQLLWRPKWSSNGAQWSSNRAQWSSNGAQMEPNGAEMEPSGAQMELKWTPGVVLNDPGGSF